MGTGVIRRALLLWLTLQAPLAAACGHCVEDKIASVYDHAVIQRALRSQQHVAFFSINGDVPANDATRKEIESIAGQTRGVLKNTVHIAADAGALSLVFDPALQDIASVQQSIEVQWRGKRLGLHLIKVMSQAQRPPPSSR